MSATKYLLTIEDLEHIYVCARFDERFDQIHSYVNDHEQEWLKEHERPTCKYTDKGTCSNCDSYKLINGAHYCPNCGARVLDNE